MKDNCPSCDVEFSFRLLHASGFNFTNWQKGLIIYKCPSCHKKITSSISNIETLLQILLLLVTLAGIWLIGTDLKILGVIVVIVAPFVSFIKIRKARSTNKWINYRE